VFFILATAKAAIDPSLGIVWLSKTLLEVPSSLLGAYIFRRYADQERPLADPRTFLYSLQIQSWLVRYGATIAGILSFSVPAALIIGSGFPPFTWRPSPEFLLAGGLALLGAAAVYVTWPGGNLVPIFVSTPFLIWLAIRGKPAEATTVLLIVAVIDLLGTFAGTGIAANFLASSDQKTLWLQSYLALRAGTILMLITMTNTKDAAHKLGEEHGARLQSMIDAVPDAIITIDERGHITFFSSAAERMFQYSEQEVLGQNVKMLMPPPYYNEHDSYLSRYLETGQKRIIGIGRVVVARRKDGSTFPIELAVGEALVHGTHVFTGLIRDISEKQQIERRLHEVQADLLHVSRLSAMGELASALAHELNQPLTAINNYLLAAQQFLRRDVLEQDQVIEIIGKSADQAVRAGQVIRQLRQFVEKREVEWELVDINRVLDEASALAFIGLKERGIQVKIERLANAPEVAIDKIQIQQVLINLIRNAVDAMDGRETRHLTITISAAAETIDIAVADTGSGIPAEISEKIFRPFTSTKASGMGVGLSISRTIVEAHSGELWFEKNPVGGTIFHVTLPLHQALA
jgi:two-component system sensor kinase FixL